MRDEAVGVENHAYGNVYGTLIQGRDITVHAAAPTPEALRGLPPLSLVFEGRTAESATVLAGLHPERSSSRSMVVSGMPGVGKSELVRQVASEAVEKLGWYSGVLHHDLRGYGPGQHTDSKDVLEGWLQNLGIDTNSIPADLQSRSLLYRSELQRRAAAGAPILVIADNASAADQVRPLIPSDHGSALLVTSRHRLDLGLPAHHLAELGPRESVEVLRGGLDLLSGNADRRLQDDPWVTERLAGLCGGLPLALRIVAALLADVPNLDPSQLADDLESERLDGLEREESAVRAAFDLSYRSLHGAQARLFRSMGLAPGVDVSTESASILLAVEQTVARRTLTALSRMSLVEASGVERWRLHDLLRVFAEEKAGSIPHRAQCGEDLSRLLAHLRFTADVADDLLIGRARPDSTRFAGVEDAVLWMESEQRVLAEAVSRSRDVGELDHTINLPMILAGFLRSRMMYEQHIELCEIGYMAAKTAGTEGDLAKLSLAQATSAIRAGDFQQALSMSDRSFCHAAEAVDWEAAASALDTEGIAFRQLGKADKALEKHDKAARMLERIGSHVHSARAHINAGNTLRVLGRKKEALRRFELAMDVYRRFDETRSYIRASLNLAGLYQELGKPLKAASHLTVVREFSRDGVEPQILAIACTNLGIILCEGGIMEEGEEALIEARDTYQMINDLQGLRQVLGILAQVYGLTGRPEKEEQARREASAVSDRSM